MQRNAMLWKWGKKYEEDIQDERRKFTGGS